MRRYAFLFFVVLALFVFTGCSQDKPTQPDSSTGAEQTSAITADPEAVAAEIVARAGWEIDPDAVSDSKSTGPARTGGGGCINWSEREVIVDDIVHYYFEVQVGSGLHDVIGLHRVVKERRPHHPIRTKKNIFLQHGDAVGFVKFLFGPASPNTPDDHAAAVYLAQQDVDVWGIDQNWILVPGGLTDFAFMAGWSMQNQIDNLRAGLAIARITRLLTGNGFGKMHLLGYSSGVMTGYAYLNEESQRPPGQRHVRGFMQADIGYKFGPESELARAAFCGEAAATGDALSAGIYADPTPEVFQTLGYLSETVPDGPSPIIEGLTNLEAFLLFGAQTYLVAPYNSWWHYFAPVVEDGQVVGVNYTPLPAAQDFVQTAAFVEAMSFYHDYAVILCDEEDVPYDDHLADITVPVLSIAPAGGIGETGDYGLTLLGSTDITILNIQLHPEDERVLDFGHIDIWTADDAPVLVWQPMVDWINSHTPGGRDVAKQWNK
jgi:hypothetical protein